MTPEVSSPSAASRASSRDGACPPESCAPGTAAAAVTIHYCELCGLRRPAEAIAEALKQQLNLQTQINKGSWGSFRVEHGGTEVFNRWKSCGWLGRIGFGRTPKPDEIVALVRARLPAARSDAVP